MTESQSASFPRIDLQPLEEKSSFVPGLLFWNDISQEWLGERRGHIEAVMIGKNEEILRRKKSLDDAES